MLVDLVSVIDDTPRMAFNITSIEGFRVLVEVGEKYQVPLILQISERYLKDLTPEFVKELVIPKLDRSTTPFVLHLDHAGTVEAVMDGIQLGFTSVMFDGSTRQMSENIRLTQEVLQISRLANVSVEAEIGHVGGAEDGDEDRDTYLTSVDEAREFMKKAPVDALAVAVGNAHGLYTKAPKLRIDRIAEIHKAIGKPLVLHGGTGIPLSDIIQAIHVGVKKINIGTELKQAWLAGARDGIGKHKELDQVRTTIREHIEQAVMGFREVMSI